MTSAVVRGSAQRTVARSKRVWVRGSACSARGKRVRRACGNCARRERECCNQLISFARYVQHKRERKRCARVRGTCIKRSKRVQRFSSFENQRVRVECLAGSEELVQKGRRLLLWLRAAQNERIRR